MHGTMTAIKNRKGRKRKSGRRTASGAIARTNVDYRALAAEWPHRRDLPTALRSDERGESEIGRLNLLKRISEAQYRSGRRFSEVVIAHRAAICAPNSALGNGQGSACNPSDCDPDTCFCRKRTERYRDATFALQGAGQRAYNTTYRIAVTGQGCLPDDLEELRSGLTVLAKHFGI